MEKTDKGVEAGRRECRDAVMADEGVKKREQAIDAVEGRLATAGVEKEIGLLLFEKMAKHREIGLRGRAFDAPQRVQIARLGQTLDAPREVADGLFDGRSGGGVRAFAAAAKERIAGIVQLACDDAAGDAQAGGGVVSRAEMRAAQGDAGIRHADHAGTQAAVFVEKIDGDPVLESEGHGSVADDDFVVQDAEALDVMHGQGQNALVFSLDDEGEVIARNE